MRESSEKDIIKMQLVNALPQTLRAQARKDSLENVAMLSSLYIANLEEVLANAMIILESLRVSPGLLEEVGRARKSEQILGQIIAGLR